ncbi:MAG: transposase [Desulfurivibrionaceae bacterium]
MSRPLRIEYPGAWYHVMNRGRRSEAIFMNDADRQAFIKVLQETVDGWNLKVSAYCLMSNHYHLLVQTPDGNLSRCMRHINGIYTQRFNRRHKKEGQLFRGRYKAVLVAGDSHLLEVLRYIHRNPIQAGIVDNLDDYSWSSHPGYVSSAKKWQWLDKTPLLDMLTDKKSRQKSAYIDFISKGEPDEIKRFYSMKNLPSILGSDSFKEFIKEKFAHLGFRNEVPESKILAPTAGAVISEVCKHYKIAKKELFASRRGKENLPRDVAIYLVRRYCRETLPSVGRYFGIENYSTVSSIIERVKTKLDRDKKLRKSLEGIGRNLNKSQKRT